MFVSDIKCSFLHWSHVCGTSIWCWVDQKDGRWVVKRRTEVSVLFQKVLSLIKGWTCSQGRPRGSGKVPASQQLPCNLYWWGDRWAASTVLIIQARVERWGWWVCVMCVWVGESLRRVCMVKIVGVGMGCQICRNLATSAFLVWVFDLPCQNR